MKIMICVAGALGALAIPVAATAQETTPSPQQTATKACKQVRAEIGKTEFRNTYGTQTKKNRNNAMRNCKRAALAQVQTEFRNASQECKAERGTPEYVAAYGDKRNAHGKCVSSKRKAAAAEVVESFKNAAKACKAAKGTPEYEAAYGTKRNAFGKCVSATAKEQREDEGTEEGGDTTTE